MKRKLAALMIAGTLSVSMAAGSVSVFAESAVDSTEAVAEVSLAEEAETEENADEEAGGLLGALIGSLGEALGADSEEGQEVLKKVTDAVSEIKAGVESGEGGLLDGLKEILGNTDGLMETVSGLLGEGSGSEFFEGVKDLLGNTDLNGISEKISSICGMFVGADGKIDWDSLKGVVSSIFGGEGQGFDMEKMIRSQLDGPDVIENPLTVAITGYICDLNKDLYEDTNIQIVAPVMVGVKQEEGSKEAYILGDFWQFNFDVDGDKLVYVSGGKSTGLLKVFMDEEAYEAEVLEGELYATDDEIDAHLDEMAAAAGITKDDYYASDRDATPNLYTDIVNVSKIYPEIKAFQVNDEVYTIEQAKDYIVNYYVNMMNQMQAAAEETAGEISEELENAAETIESGAEKLVEEVASVAEDVLGAVESVVEEVASEATEAAE